MFARKDRKGRFDALARLYADDLYRFAVWLCRDPALADDLVQETFVRAWKALDSLKDADKAKSWLITILRREYARTFERKVPPLVSIDDVTGLEEDDETPDERLEKARFREWIMQLEAKYREPLVLQVLMGMAISEIAEALELTESAVMTRVFRARAQLKEQAERSEMNRHGPSKS
jgi:RNA polymerase sigma-70 factor (ECF subfamily)